MENQNKNHRKSYSEKGLWKKLVRVAKKLGTKTVYTILLLYYAYRRKETPSWAKNIIIGAIGYFISPIDAIPDLTPVIGYTDDLGVLSFGLVTISCYVNKEVKNQARDRISRWFKQVDERELDSVDDQL